MPTLVPILAAAVARGGDRGVYDLLVGLHVVCAVAGFGTVAISGAYGAIGRRASRPGSPSSAGSGEEVSRYFASPNRAEYLLLVAPLFGIGAMAVRPGGSEFGQLWAVLGVVIWVVASVLLLAVVRPAEARIRAAAREGGGEPTASARLMWAAGASDLLFVVALLVMVAQPR